MIWIIGNKGMLGQELQAVLTQAGLAVLGTDREVDFTDAAAIEDCHARLVAARGSRLDWMINCAAYTAVDKAEDEPALCRKLNVDGPAVLASFAAAQGCGLIHISTDYVFDGQGIPGADGKPRPYIETDPVGPTGVYGLTKAQGEDAVRAGWVNHIILRTAWLYGLCGPNFVYTMLKLMRNRDAIGVVVDQWGTPTWARDLAETILGIARTSVPVWGTFHVSGAGVTNWHAFAQEIYRQGRTRGLIGREVAINALTTDQYPTKTTRPAWSVLDKSKLISSYRTVVPPWETSLSAFLDLAAAGQDNPDINRFWSI
jgi:dTDP-4-dehydrorhamnose reductase